MYPTIFAAIVLVACLRPFGQASEIVSSSASEQDGPMRAKRASYDFRRLSRGLQMLRLGKRDVTDLGSNFDDDRVVSDVGDLIPVPVSFGNMDGVLPAESIVESDGDDGDDGSVQDWSKRAKSKLRLGKRQLQMLRLGKRFPSDGSLDGDSSLVYGDALDVDAAAADPEYVYPLVKRNLNMLRLGKRGLEMLRLGKRSPLSADADSDEFKRGLQMLRLGKRGLEMLRLGKRADLYDKKNLNMLRLGKREDDEQEKRNLNMLRLGKRGDTYDKKNLNMLRLGKREDATKRNLNMLRLGKRSVESEKRNLKSLRLGKREAEDSSSI